jgi:hypothetical protein
MTLCGLKIIAVPDPVPSSLRFGRYCAVVSFREYVELVQDAAPGAVNRTGKISALLQEYDDFLKPTLAGQ